MSFKKHNTQRWWVTQNKITGGMRCFVLGTKRTIMKRGVYWAWWVSPGWDVNKPYGLVSESGQELISRAPGPEMRGQI